jgi:hypothetical protein
LRTSDPMREFHERRVRKREISQASLPKQRLTLG